MAAACVAPRAALVRDRRQTHLRRGPGACDATRECSLVFAAAKRSSAGARGPRHRTCRTRRDAWMDSPTGLLCCVYPGGTRTLSLSFC